MLPSGRKLTTATAWPKASVAATARMAINCSSESPGWIVAGAAGGGAGVTTAAGLGAGAGAGAFATGADGWLALTLPCYWSGAILLSSQPIR